MSQAKNEHEVMTTEQEKFLRYFVAGNSALDPGWVVRLRAAVAAMLARCEKAEAEAKDLYDRLGRSVGQRDFHAHGERELMSRCKKAEAERDAALVKLGVVSEAWSKKTNYDADPDGAYGPGVSLRRDHADMIDAAIASEPEIIGMVKVVGFYGKTLWVEYPQGYRAAASDRAILVRGA